MTDIGLIWQTRTLLVAAILAGSAVITFVLICALMPLMRRYTMARPNARSSHKEPTPQGAGMAIVTVTVIAAAALAAVLPAYSFHSLLTVLTAAVVLAILGVTDDIKPLEALPRLGVQSISVLAVIAVLPSTLHIIPVLPVWFERALLLIGLLWFVNLVNFMDGVDWMTIVETVPLTAALAVFGLTGALPADATLVALTLCGALIGFAPLNRPVAKVFLGDVGSLPIGLLIGWLLILLAQQHPTAAFLLPLYYLTDATVTLLRRLTRGEQVMQAHRSHFYQRALVGGLSVYAIIGRVFVLNIALIGLASATMAASSWLVHIAALSTGCILVGLQLYRFERIRK